jgi:deoxyribodipyrimidine photolyase-related protein
MTCIACAVRQSLEHAYAHHIQRLMVTGNFALLAGVHPDEVDAWYLGIYIDAVQWVEIVNTRGMSQFADGGIVATKPYISSANYIRKMSDYCDTCHYDHGRKTGDRACPFNSLYWDFLDRHRERLQNNPRIGMMYRTWDRMSAQNRKALLAQARQYKRHLNEL